MVCLRGRVWRKDYMKNNSNCEAKAVIYDK